MVTLKFLVDECVGLLVAHWLKENGFDTISIMAEMPGISDDEVLAKAFLENRILITSDKDFGDMIFKKKSAHHGIILLRIQSKIALSKIQVLENLLKNHSHELFDNFIVISDSGIRIIKQLFH
jgi:predicted nuclease of predicted toxin-antitoxin system